MSSSSLPSQGNWARLDWWDRSENVLQYLWQISMCVLPHFLLWSAATAHLIFIKCMGYSENHMHFIEFALWKDKFMSIKRELNHSWQAMCQEETWKAPYWAQRSEEWRGHRLGFAQECSVPCQASTKDPIKDKSPEAHKLIQLEWNFLDPLSETIYLLESLNIMAPIYVSFHKFFRKIFKKSKFLEFCFQNTQ